MSFGLNWRLLLLALVGATICCSRPQVVELASHPAESPLVALDRTLSGLASAEWADARTSLTAMGFSADRFDELVSLRVVSAERVERNLDEEPSLESLVHVQIEAMFEDGPDSGGSQALHLLAWLRVDSDGIRTIATRTFLVSSCIIDGGLEVVPRFVRSRSFEDIVVTWTDAPGCDGNFGADMGTSILALLSEGLHEIFNYSDYTSIDRVSHEELDEQLVAQIGTEIPAVVTILPEGGGEARFRYEYQPDELRYRVVAEMASRDARVAAKLDSRDWSNRCFTHIKAGRYSHALAACNRGVELLSPGLDNLAGALFYNLGLIALRTGDNTLAAAHLRHSLQVRPGNLIVENALREVESTRR